MRITLVLTLQVTYEANDASVVPGLRDNLLDLATRASREGLLTGDVDAEVVVAAPHVEELTK